MTYEEGGERFAIGLKLPYTQDDWHAKRRATDTVLEDVKGVCRLEPHTRQRGDESRDDRREPPRAGSAQRLLLAR